MDHLLLLLYLASIISGVLNTIESLIFMYKVFPIKFQLVNLLNISLVSLAVGFTIAFFWGEKDLKVETKYSLKFSSGLILPWTGWTITWFIIYFSAGFLIAYLVPEVHEYYFSETGQSAMDMSKVPLGFLMQIPRGAIWIFLALGIQKYTKGSNWEISLLTGLLFGGMMSADLISPNFLFTDIVRLAHLPEVLFGNLFWGIFIAQRLNKRIKAEI